MIYDIAIIGAGAAGLFAGASMGELTTDPPLPKTIVIEQNSTPGKKLLLAGSGQCNLTHAGNIKEFLSHYGTNGSTLRSILYPFNNLAVMDFFQRLGVSLIEREDGKIFPSSLRGTAVLNALLTASSKNGVKFSFRTKVVDLHREESKDCWLIHLRSSNAATDSSTTTNFSTAATSTFPAIASRNVIVAGGGCSFPSTGSDGSLFPLLQKLGLPLTAPRPALVPLYVEGYPFQELSGISFPTSTLILKQNGRTAASESGPLLLTHTCFSGPAILSLSRYAKPGDTLSISWIDPNLEASLKDQMFGHSSSSRQISTKLAELTGLARRFSDRLCRRAGISPEEKISSLTGTHRKQLLLHLFHDEYSISGTGGFSIAMATAGGVPLKAVHLKTMESKTHPGLYFAGEILDVDGDTGGYNLQFAFSSARLAIKSAMLNLTEPPLNV